LYKNFFFVRLRVVVVAVALLAATVRVSAHANSVSYAQFSVDGRVVRAVVRLPIDDVDLLLRLDRDLDGRVSDGELEASATAVREYFAKHLRLAANGAPASDTVDRISVWRDPSAFQYLEVDLSYRAARAVGQLSIRSDFLTELYPSHKTLGHIFYAGLPAGRDDRFTFERGSTYERQVGPEFGMTFGLAVAGAVVLCLLWLARRRSAAAAIAMLLVALTAHADVIMSAPALNTTLKTMEKLARETKGDVSVRRAEALFKLGAEADGLASIMNLEVESHGMQERELLDLALGRTKELGIVIAYNREKKKFFYDGAAFAEYLKQAPRGEHAADSEFKLISYRFYQSSGADTATLAAAAAAKKAFLARYRTFEGNAEVRLYLAVDYRDLQRRFAEAKDEASAAKYRDLARAECRRITRQYPRTEQADAAKQLLRGLR
jgi:hypothetical protein